MGIKFGMPKRSRHFSMNLCSTESKAFLASSEMIKASMLSSMLAAVMVARRALMFSLMSLPFRYAVWFSPIEVAIF